MIADADHALLWSLSSVIGGNLLQGSVGIVRTIGQFLWRSLSIAVPVLVDDFGVHGLGAGDVGGGHTFLLLVEQILQEGEDCDGKEMSGYGNLNNFSVQNVVTGELQGQQSGDQSLQGDQLDDGEQNGQDNGHLQLQGEQQRQEDLLQAAAAGFCG